MNGNERICPHARSLSTLPIKTGDKIIESPASHIPHIIQLFLSEGRAAEKGSTIDPSFRGDEHTEGINHILIRRAYVNRLLEKNRDILDLLGTLGNQNF